MPLSTREHPPLGAKPATVVAQNRENLGQTYIRVVYRPVYNIPCHIVEAVHTRGQGLLAFWGCLIPQLEYIQVTY